MSNDSSTLSAKPRSMAERLGMDQANFARKFGRDWHLTVIGTDDLSPHMRRISLQGGDLDELKVRPGQSVVLLLPQPDGSDIRRHYTIRRIDHAKKRLDIDFVMHGDAPAASWARRAKPGDQIDALGPRGRVWLNPDADWHLFAGDETGLPAIFAMIEALPTNAKAVAIIEVAGKADELPVSTKADLALTWIHRNGPAHPGSQPLIDAVAGVAVPHDRRAHIYLTGETSTVRAQRHALQARGVAKDRIWAEGYWRPGRVGGHDHVDE